MREKLKSLVLTDEPPRGYVIDLDVPASGVQKMKVEAWPIVSDDGHSAVHFLTLENVTSLLRAAADVGPDFTGSPDEPDV